MRCTLIKARELSPDLIATWSDFQRATPLIASPALRPELFQIVGRHSPLAEVAILEEGNTITGFLPFNRHRIFGSIAKPILICDYQDFIRAPDCDVSLPDLLNAAGLGTWVFDHLLLKPSVSSEVHISSVRHSKRVQFNPGYGDYVAEMKANGKSMRNTITKLRLLRRDHGDILFDENSGDESVLSTLLKWKAQRFNKGRPIDSWVLDTLVEIMAENSSEFAGVLATLHAGDKLVAAHFGMKSGNTLYYWFPAFNPEFSKYTPGWLLVYLLLQTAGNLGCDVIDLGPGGESYKDYFSNVQIPVVSGYVELPGTINMARRSHRAMLRGLRGNRAAYSVLHPVRHFLGRFL